jgi:hypothetical protein
MLSRSFGLAGLVCDGALWLLTWGGRYCVHGTGSGVGPESRCGVLARV